MCKLAATSKFDVRKIPVRGQLEHGCQSGKGIDHLILLSRNVVKGYVIEVLYQFPDVGEIPLAKLAWAHLLVKSILHSDLIQSSMAYGG